MIIDGREVALTLKKKLAEQLKSFPKKYGRVPHLTIIVVGNDPASHSYIRGKKKAADFVGITNTVLKFPSSVNEHELLETIYKLNKDKN